jgi:pimeloyl-ACP methyl ester carboxylesterase
MGDEHFCELPSGVQLCYVVDGEPRGRPIMLLTGIGLDLWSWSPSLVTALTAAGFRVIRFDNRDSGRSSRMSNRPPGPLRHFIGGGLTENYSLEDMADDAIGLLDHLGIPAVDVVGMSLGGMVGQILATRHADRVITLVCIFSTTGSRRVGRPSAAVVIELMKPAEKDGDEFVRGHLRLMSRIASGPYGFDAAAEERWARKAWERMDGVPGHVPGDGIARQIAAIDKSGDRTAQLRTITKPTLVIHGDRDPLIHPSGGAAIARAVPGARLVTIPGMRHHLPASVTPNVSDLITEHALGAGAARSAP